MADLATITTILGNLKVATDIAKALRDSDLSAERAELKLKLAEMMSALADAKIETMEIQHLLLGKEHQIAELEEAFQSKHSLIKVHDAYYRHNASGSPIGEPFCAHCWQVKHKQHTLCRDSKDNFVRVCIACGHKYSGRMVRVFSQNGEADADA